MRKSQYHAAYDKTPKGYLVRKYSAMKWRVEGRLFKASGRGESYKGLPIVGPKEFYAWSLNDPRFNFLFQQWKEGGCLIRQAPTVDRVDPKKGYLFENMEWVTHSENSIRACLGREGGRQTKFRGVSYDKREVSFSQKKGRRRWIAQIYQGKKLIGIGRFFTEEEAARAYDRWAKMIYGRAINFPE